MGGGEEQLSKLGYRFEAVPDDHPAWNRAMETWWEQGGALLWNQYGGMGSTALCLDPETATKFLREAALIDGWVSHTSSTACGEPPLLNPLVVSRETANEDELPPVEPPRPVQPRSVDSMVCCIHCGRNINPALSENWSGDMICLPPRVLNHVLNSLEEAIDFARGRGANNFRTWLAHLDDTANALKQG